MPKELKNYLELMFRVCNHPKYRKYFDEWVNNLLPHQIEGFNKQRLRMLKKHGKYMF